MKGLASKGLDASKDLDGKGLETAKEKREERRGEWEY